MLLFVGMLAVPLAWPASLIVGAMGVAAFALAAVLFTQAPTRRLLLASALLGLLSTLVGLAAGSGGFAAELILPYTALTAFATIVCATGASSHPDAGDTPAR